MNSDTPLTLRVPLTFLGAGRWNLRAFADTAESVERPEKILETSATVEASQTLELSLAPSGGYAAELSPQSRSTSATFRPAANSTPTTTP